MTFACGGQDEGGSGDLDLMQRFEKVPGPQTANTRCQLVASNDQNLDARDMNVPDEGMHASRPLSAGGAADAAGFRAVRRADEIGVAGNPMPLAATHGVGEQAGQFSRQCLRLDAGVAGKTCPYPLVGRMDRSGRYDPLLLKGTYESAFQEADPVGFNHLEAASYKHSTPAGVLLHDEDIGCRTRTADGFGCPPPELSAADDPEFLHAPPPGSAVCAEVESLLLRPGQSLVKHDRIC